jgi:hypothetical protein
VAASESLNDHLAGLGEGFLPMFGKDGEHPAQERVLGRAEMVKQIRKFGGAWLG